VSDHVCCDRGVDSVKIARISLRSAGWIVPCAILAVMPKCPVCVAAYVTLLTGVGISLTAAAYSRVSLLMFCVVLLVYVAARSIRRIFI
jgi:hypothetical protein